MWLSTTLIAASLASLVYCQSIDYYVSQLPSCSLSCLDMLFKAGGCTPKDYACGCNPSGTSLQTLATQCIRAACSLKDILCKSSQTNSNTSIFANVSDSPSFAKPLDSNMPSSIDTGLLGKSECHTGSIDIYICIRNISKTNRFCFYSRLRGHVLDLFYRAETHLSCIQHISNRVPNKYPSFFEHPNIWIEPISCFGGSSSRSK
jgi:hypothetical protein